MNDSIFAQYYRDEPFVDRFQRDGRDAIDVIIPVVHTNELWRANLTSIFREVPVRKLLISDGGCKDDSLEVARQFPRVEILDHRSYKTLGFSLRKLIEAVETEWFAYLHSDVYLPPGWFDAMKSHQGEYDWFGCPQRITALVEYPNVDILGGIPRPHAGSQMGRKGAFEAGIKEIDDDYVYRQEDLVLQEMVVKHGYKAGGAEDIFHYHQMMHKESPWSRKLTSVAVRVEWSHDEKVRAATMQIRGIVKYLRPSRPLALEVERQLRQLIDLGATTESELRRWILETRPEWQGWIKPWRVALMSLADNTRSRVGALLRRARDL